MSISNVSPLSAIVAGVMKDEKSNLNRSASLIALMYKDEVTHAIEVLTSIFLASGTDRTNRIDAQLKDVSPDFVGALDLYNTLKEKKAAERTDADKNMMETTFNTMRAARQMWTRALVAVYGLRKNEATECKASTRKTGSLAVEYFKGTNEKTGKDKYEDKEETCSQLINKGQKLVDELKPTKATAARNPMGTSIENASKALASALASKNKGKVTPITDFADDTNKQLEATLEELFRMKFFDGATFDKPTFNEWLARTFAATAKDKPAKAA